MGHGLGTVTGAAGRMNGRREPEGRGVSLLAAAVSSGRLWFIIGSIFHLWPWSYWSQPCAPQGIRWHTQLPHTCRWSVGLRPADSQHSRLIPRLCSTHSPWEDSTTSQSHCLCIFSLQHKTVSYTEFGCPASIITETIFSTSLIKMKNWRAARQEIWLLEVIDLEQIRWNLGSFLERKAFWWSEFSRLFLDFEWGDLHAI